MDIKGVVKSHGLTLIDVATKMGITKGAISQIVNGSPNMKTLRTIAQIIGCQVGDFFKDEMTVEEKEAEPIIRCPNCGKELRISVQQVD